MGVSDTYTDISGQLVVNKTIAGDGAGHQGAVTIHVACTGVDASLTPDFTIPAGGSSDSNTYPGLPPGTPCTVTETADGAITGVVEVTTTGSPQAVTIPASGSVAANVTDTYTLVTGSLVVTKTIAAGGAAGLQGQIVIHVDCSDGVPRPDFVIDAGAPAGNTTSTYVRRYSGRHGVHGDGNVGWAYQHGGGRGVHHRLAGHDPRRRHGHGRRQRHLHRHLGPAGGQQDDRRGRGRTPGRGDDPCRLHRRRCEL